MPFKSEKQRKWMWVHEPEIARKWTKKYGSKPKKKKRKKRSPSEMMKAYKGKK